MKKKLALDSVRNGRSGMLISPRLSIPGCHTGRCCFEINVHAPSYDNSIEIYMENNETYIGSSKDLTYDYDCPALLIVSFSLHFRHNNWK